MTSRREFLTVAAAATLCQRPVSPHCRTWRPLVSPHLALGADQHHRDRPGALRHRVVARVLEAHRGSRASSSMPAGSSPITRASSRCTIAREFLGDRDLYGELAKAAHEDGLAVLARMDSNRTARGFLPGPSRLVRQRRSSGKPYRAGETVRHLRQQPVLRRVPAGGPARDHRAQPSRGLHRQ